MKFINKEEKYQKKSLVQESVKLLSQKPNKRSYKPNRYHMLPEAKEK